MTIILFDVDGTLALCGQRIEDPMVDVLRRLSQIPDVNMGIVGGGTYSKIQWQLGKSIEYFRYVFAECGAIVYMNGLKIREKSLLDVCDRHVLNKVLARALREISNMPIIFHGQQLDFRQGLIYVSPPGMQASEYERSYFLEKDKELGLRQKLIDSLYEEVKDSDASPLEITVGGSVGIAIYPKGWDKSQVLEYFISEPPSRFIYYLGDRTELGGNDYPLYIHPRVSGISIKNPSDTIVKISELFLRH